MKKNFKYLFVGFYLSIFQSLFSQQISVRKGLDLPEQEQYYLQQRHTLCKQALENILGFTLNDEQVPRIALCLSGGGYRSMISSFGFLEGLHTPANRSFFSSAKETVGSILFFLDQLFSSIFDIHAPIITTAFPSDPTNNTLFNAATYCACLSGSAWGISCWMQSNMNLSQYVDHITPYLNSPLAENISWTHLAGTLAQRIKNEQTISLIDMYGIMIGQKLLSGIGADNPGDFDCSMLAEKIAHGAIPFPIFTAIIGENVPEKEWVEFTPYEVGSEYQQTFIPMAQFGSVFTNGILTKNNSPESLSFLLGLWGSAMCMDLPEFIAFLQRQFPELACAETSLEAFLDSMESALNMLLSLQSNQLHHKSLFDYRPFAPKVPNWAYNVPNTPTNELEQLVLVDAGLDFRIPLPPLLRAQRALDIIIIVDASDLEVGTALQSAQAYAQKHDVLFPPIDYGIINNPCSVHRDPNNTATPIVIYFPLVKNPAYANGWDPRTASFDKYTNFQYTQNDINLLRGLMKTTALQYQPVIIDVIKKWVENRTN